VKAHTDVVRARRSPATRDHPTRDHATRDRKSAARSLVSLQMGSGMAQVLGGLHRWLRRNRSPNDREIAYLELEQAHRRLEQINADLSGTNRELERTNAQLRRSVEELEAFAGEISHDLKGPLSTICGFAQLLTHLDIGASRPVEYDDFVTEICDGAERMRQLIDDVLAYATVREATLRLAPVELGPLVDEVVAAHTRHLRHRGGQGQPTPDITTAALPAVLADRVMLQRVIDNLVGNAIKYVLPGKAARVHVTARPFGTGWVRIEVADQGIGIPDGQHEAIFSGLHRSHVEAGYPGAGLGLAICRRIVQRHGGSIGAGVEPHGGSRFWLTLPAVGTVTTQETERLAVAPASAL
jgi:signal transduction histidine kinase